MGVGGSHRSAPAVGWCPPPPIPVGFAPPETPLRARRDRTVAVRTCHVAGGELFIGKTWVSELGAALGSSSVVSSHLAAVLFPLPQTHRELP